MSVVSRVLVLVFVLLSGSGCSIKMMYNNADRIARWAVNDYIHIVAVFVNAKMQMFFNRRISFSFYYFTFKINNLLFQVCFSASSLGVVFTGF